jgi:hypothetical protein
MNCKRALIGIGLTSTAAFRSWLPACAVLAYGCATVPTQTSPVQVGTPAPTTMVKADTPTPASSATTVGGDRPVPPSPAKAELPAVAIQHPEVDLRPPAPVPLMILTLSGGDWPEDYTLEIDRDGTGRFVGSHNVCVTGERSLNVPSDTLEEAKRIVLESHVFDRPTPHCSKPTDSPAFLIYFSEPPPGRKVAGGLCAGENLRVSPAFRLGAKLQHLLDLNGWIGNYPKCQR